MSRIPINLVHAEVLSPHARALAEGGAPVERLFEACGIPLQAVQNSESMVTMRQGYQLMEEAARYAGEENFGSRIGMDLRLYELGALGHAVRRAPTLCDAGSVVMAAIRASEPGSQCWIEHHEREAWFCYRPVKRFAVGGAQAEQFDLECLLQFIRLAAGADWVARKVRVSVVTADVLRKTQNFADAKVERNATMTAIAFPSDLLARRLAGRHSDLAETFCRENGSAPETALGTSGAVVLVLESLFEFETIPTLEVTAERFGVTSRTLQRALTNEGTSYRQLTERIIYRRAVSLLEEERMSLKMISGELGYSSPSSFVRAFSRIAGTTPMAYRKAMLGSH